MSGDYFYCDRCGVELWDEPAAAIGAGWTDGSGREIVTCPACGHEGGKIERGDGSPA